MSVFLHVGAPKTGTTTLQHVLRQNRRALARVGVSYPGTGADHFHAAQDLLGINFAGWRDPRTEGAWERLVTEVNAWQGRHCVVSHELLAWASPETIERAVDAFSPHEVHVVYTVRDLSRLVPAMWQESLKNRGTVPMGKALRRMRNRAGSLEPGKTPPLARAVNPAGVLEQWAAATGAARVHVLVLGKDAHPDQLWWDFAGLLGVDPASFETTRPSNPSLGVAEAELLRRLNQVLGKDTLDWPDYDRLIKKDLAQRVLAPGATNKITLPESDHDWVTRWAHDQVEQLTTAGYDIRGDPRAIIPPVDREEAPPLREKDVAGAATTALAHVLTRLAAAERSRVGTVAWLRRGLEHAVRRRGRGRVRSG